MIDCYYLKNKMRNINQIVKTLIRSCQDILTLVLCENFIVTTKQISKYRNCEHRVFNEIETIRKNF